MILTALSLRNFMCYRELVEIDLRNVRIACLSGDNGAGKSALLDSITWALWGKARVNSDRELIALNASEMEVRFGFILDDQEFRVTRRRTRRGAGPLMLDLEVGDGDRWRVLSGATTKETQDAINRLLRLDYDTFINSAFILQGRADEFTTKTPALRKQVLADILNLSDYDRVEERARVELRERDRQAQELEAEINRVDRLHAELPTLQQAVAALSADLVTINRQAQEKAERLASSRLLVQTLERSAAQRDEIQREIDLLRQEIDRLTGERAQVERQIAVRRDVLARRDDILARHQRLNRLRIDNETLSARLAERQEWLGQRQQVERELQQAINEVESRLQVVRSQLRSKLKIVEAEETTKSQIENARREIMLLVGLDDHLNRLRQDQLAVQTQHGELTAENRQLRAEMHEIKQRIEEFDAIGAQCPVCQTELSDEERARVRSGYQSDGRARKERYVANQQRLTEIKNELARLEDEIAKLGPQRERFEKLQRTCAVLEERLTGINAAAAEIDELRTTGAELEAALKCGSPGAAQRAELARIDDRLHGLPYDRSAHLAVQDEIRRLAQVEQELRQLDAAEAALDGEQRQLASLEQSLHRCHVDLGRKTELERELSESLGQLEAARLERDMLEADFERLEMERNELQERFGAAQQRLADCLELERVRDELLARRSGIVEEKMIYEELVLAFGKRGIQAMIIENIVPELQDEANAILDRMPGNTMRIEFQTQRQALRGDSMIETLDIMIGDEAGRRQYELYSGGEAFRVNFAIRVALSMLLARRAGTRLQTLVIDEGFGTQDGRGRDGLVEAIRAIERDFETILVITHIAELKDVFPSKIEVVKTPTGSIVSVN